MISQLDYWRAEAAHHEARASRLEAELARLREHMSMMQQHAAPPAQPAQPAPGYVIVPDWKGYALLGAGHYLLNNSAAGSPPELVISIATEAEKVGRTIGDERMNVPDAPPIQPEDMAIRIGFDSVIGLDALEGQLRHLRSEHFPDTAAQPARQLVSVSSIDIERMIAECLPGGHSCDPQQVADAIRQYCNAAQPAQAQPGKA